MCEDNYFIYVRNEVQSTLTEINIQALAWNSNLVPVEREKMQKQRVSKSGFLSLAEKRSQAFF
jgi:hypothetical protein